MKSCTSIKYCYHPHAAVVALQPSELLEEREPAASAISPASKVHSQRLVQNQLYLVVVQHHLQLSQHLMQQMHLLYIGTHSIVVEGHDKKGSS